MFWILLASQDRGVGRAEYPSRSARKLDRRVHDRVANEAGEGGDALFFAPDPAGWRYRNMTGRKLKAKEPTFARPDKDGLQQRHIQPRQQSQNIVTLSELPIPNMIPQNESNATGSMKVFPSCWKNLRRFLRRFRHSTCSWIHKWSGELTPRQDKTFYHFFSAIKSHIQSDNKVYKDRTMIKRFIDR